MKEKIGDIMRKYGLSYSEAKATLPPKDNPSAKKNRPALGAIRSGDAATLAHRFFPPPYKFSHGTVWTEDGQHKLLDVRGWGHLIGQGQPEYIENGALAAEVQDWIGARIAEVLSTHMFAGKEAP